MKKIIKLLFVLILLIAPHALKAETEVYIYPVATAKASYQSGETIKGQFTIHNLLETRQSDVYYEIGIKIGDSFKSSVLVEKQKFDPLYLEAKSKRIIPFEYTVPNTIDGRAYVSVYAYSADGNMLAFGNAPILITQNSSTQIKTKVMPREGYFVVTGNGRVDFANDNRFYPNDEVSLELLFSKSDVQSPITASVTLTQINSKEVTTLDPFEFQLSATEQKYVTIPLPKSMTPGLYELEVAFENDSLFVPLIKLNYTLLGPVITFNEVTASHLSFKKNKELEIVAGYRIPTSSSPEEYEAIFAPLKNSTAVIKVVNEKEETVFEDAQLIDLTQSTEIIFKKRTQVPAEYISATIKILDQDNKVVSEYTSNFPSEEQVSAWYKTSEIGWMSVLFGSVLLLVIIVGLALHRRFSNRNISKDISMLSVVIFGTLMFGVGLFPVTTNASTVEQGTLYGPSITGFLDEIFYSPLPQEVRSYDPNEAFDLYASVGVFGNIAQGANFRAYRQIENRSGYCVTNNLECSWFHNAFTPPSSLYNALSVFDRRNSACDYPVSGIRNLMDWFLCNGASNVGYEYGSSSLNIRNLQDFTYTSYGSTYLIDDADWYGSGLLTGSDYLPLSKEFESEVSAVFSMLYGGVVSQKAHNYSIDVDEFSSPYSPSGVMLQMFSHKYNWIDALNAPSYLDSQFRVLHFKYFNPLASYRAAATATARKNDYNAGLPLINKAKDIIIAYNMPGASVVSAFNFNDVDAIDAAGYNSTEFNVAIDVVLDFYYALSYSLHDITYNISSTIATQQANNANEYAYVPRSYDIEMDSYFMAPPDPGVYKIYYYGLLAQNAPTYETTWKHDDKDILVSQTICVRGGGFCPDEEPIVCPNLEVEGGPVYTESAGGAIYQDGVLTDLEKDENGNCQVPTICNPNVDFEQTTCVAGFKTIRSCLANGTWSTVDTGITCDVCDVDTYSIQTTCTEEIEYVTSCDLEGRYITTKTGNSCTNFTVSCASNPTSVAVNANTTFTATANKPATYEWLSDSNASLGNSSTLVKSYSVADSYTVTINAAATETTQTASNTCSVSVTDCPNTGQEICQAGYKYVYVCTNGTQSLNPTGELCPPTTLNPLIDVNQFEFDPNVVSVESGMCTLKLNVSGAQECRLVKDSDEVGSYSATSGSITSTTNPYSIGTYSLECAVPVAEGETLDFSGPYGTQKCILNPSVKEN